MKTVKIEFITDSGCERCEEAKRRVSALLAENAIIANIVFHKADSARAGELSVDYGLDDIPSFLVNGRVFEGEKFSSDEFLVAARRK